MTLKFEYKTNVQGATNAVSVTGRLKASDIEILSQHHHMVEKFDISGSDLSKDETVKSLALFFGRSMSLEVVDLSNCGLGEVSDEVFANLMTKLGNSSAHLTHLNLSGNILNSEGKEKAVSQLLERTHQDRRFTVNIADCGLPIAVKKSLSQNFSSADLGYLREETQTDADDSKLATVVEVDESSPSNSPAKSKTIKAKAGKSCAIL